MRQPLGLGLASGVVAADGAIARRRGAPTTGGMVNRGLGHNIDKPLTFGTGYIEISHVLAQPYWLNINQTPHICKCEGGFVFVSEPIGEMG